MKLFITGINGFLGTHVTSILQDDHEIIGIFGNSNSISNFSNIKQYNFNRVNEINEIPDAIIMCHAAISSGNVKTSNENLYNANVLFTEQLTNKYPDAYHLYISSVSVYGNREEKLNEYSLLNPQNEYAVSKLWGEKIICLKAGSGILRLTSLYGTGMKQNTIIPIYVNQALQNKKIEVWGQGERKQNYFNVNDAVHYISKMVERKSTDVHLGISQKEVSNLELAKMIGSITNAELVFKNVDNALSYSFNNEITREKLQIDSEIDLFDGLKNYIDWKRRQF
jgi:UDP-glucose 4-epimerase